ncbi:MAG: hypothetical protein LBK61_05730 [Spirochaetaceae bacterium]|nr:hypothetical protein [Spirochaetaceae bacterium]
MRGLAECPCGGRKPFGFSSSPCRGRKPAGFSSLLSFYSRFAFVPSPILAGESAAGRQNTVMRRLCFPCGRAMPPHDGILPAVTMPDRGGRNR